MTVGRSRLYPCSSGPPAPRNGSKPLRKAKSAPRSGERIPRHPVWSQKARPDVQTSIRPGLKSSCSVIRIDAARYYSASLRLQQIFDAAAKRAGQSEHGGDGSFAKVFAALLVHLDGAQAYPRSLSQLLLGQAAQLALALQSCRQRGGRASVFPLARLQLSEDARGAHLANVAHPAGPQDVEGRLLRCVVEGSG